MERKTMKPITLYLIRHGQSEGNVNTQVYYDKNDCDIELTALGHSQSLGAGAELARMIDHTAPRIICSAYMRAKQTASGIYSVLAEDHQPSLQEDVLLREREWGSLRTVVDNRHLKREEHFNFYYRAQGGESFADAYTRVVLFFQWLELRRLRNPHDDSPIVIVSHGEWIRLALMYLDGNTVEYFTVNRKNPKNCVIHTRTLS
jgi:broad specificity phosphatase PhoE